MGNFFYIAIIAVTLIMIFLTLATFAKQRKHKRAVVIGYCIGFGIILIFLGDSKTIYLIPAMYVGYFLCIIAALALVGVNIWYGGPLDPRKDQEQEEDSQVDDEIT